MNNSRDSFSLVDRLCDRFEAAWKAGEPIAIETLLQESPPDQRPSLLGELLAVELAYRARASEAVEREEYHTRFPAYEAVVASAFDRHSTDTGRPEPLTGWPSTAMPSGADVPRVAPACGPPDVPGYEILEKLGEGGMGVVYKARDLGLGRVVALKMLRGVAQPGEEGWARFQTEAEAVARLQHPNIVQIHEVGTSGGQPFLTLEYCAGGSLARKARDTPQQPRAAAASVETLARAVHAAHVAGVVHRDLKPANVLLTESGELKLTDFGLAKKLDDAGRTVTGAVMGTPSYMPPEQALGRVREVGPLADVYSLGAVLYELLTGRPPFLGANTMDTLYLVVEQEPVPPSRLQPKTPRDLETICLKCLEKPAARRYASARELAEDLERFREGRPILARPVGRGERLGKWARRNPSLAGLVVVSALAMALLFGGAVYVARASRAELSRLREADEARESASQLYREAVGLSNAGSWNGAREKLVSAAGKLDTAEKLDPRPEAPLSLRADLDRLLAEAVGKLASSRERDDANRKLVERFKPAYHNALFHATLDRFLTTDERREQCKREAILALAEYGLDGPGAEGANFRQALGLLGEADRAALTGECFELLLVLAEVEAGAAGGRGLEVALRHLAVAESLGPRSVTLARRKARYEARLRGGPEPAEANLDAPANSLDWFLLGMDRYEAGRFTDARLACGKVLRAQPDHYMARYLEGLCFLRDARWAEGREAMSLCLAKPQKFPWPHVMRGFASRELGILGRNAAEHFEAASRDFDAALAGNPDHLLAYTVWINRGELFRAWKKHGEAKADFFRAKVAKPLLYLPYYNLAAVHFETGDFAGAEKVLDEGVAALPGEGMLYAMRARVHARRREAGRAGNDLMQALALIREGKTIHLFPALEEVSRLHRAGTPARAELARQTLARAGKALKVSDADDLAWLAKARALAALGRHKEAGPAYDRHLKLTRQPTAEKYRERGEVYALTGHYADAAASFRVALSLDPKDMRSKVMRGWAYLYLGLYREALADFADALEAGGSPEALAPRGLAHAKLGSWREATADAERLSANRGKMDAPAAYAAARLLTLLATQPRPGKDSRVRNPTAERYLMDAAGYLERAVDSRPEGERERFWQEVVVSEPDLRALRLSKACADLVKKYQPRSTK